MMITSTISVGCTSNVVARGNLTALTAFELGKKEFSRNPKQLSNHIPKLKSRDPLRLSSSGARFHQRRNMFLLYRHDENILNPFQNRYVHTSAITFCLLAKQTIKGYVSGHLVEFLGEL